MCHSLIKHMVVLIQRELHSNDEPDDSESRSESLDVPDVAQDCHSKHANHMTMTTSGQIMPWSDCLKTKENVNIKLRDLCETLTVYILLGPF